MKKSTLLIFISASLTAIALMMMASCKGADKNASTPDSTSVVRRPTLTVSIEPQRYLLEQIAGDKFEVNTLLPNGFDPENFDPSIPALKKASESLAYFTTGGMTFEEVTSKHLSESNSEIIVVNTSNGLPLLRGTHSTTDHNHGNDDLSNDIDPHIWSSVKSAKTMAYNMYATILKIDPYNKPRYSMKFNKLMMHLDSLDTAIDSILAPCRGEAFMVWHPSLSYFARDYGLKQVAMGSDNKETSVAALKKRIDRAAASGAKVFFVQPDYDGSADSRAAAIIRDTEATPVTINPLDYNWEKQILGMAHAIADAHNASQTPSSKQ